MRRTTCRARTWSALLTGLVCLPALSMAGAWNIQDTGTPDARSRKDPAARPADASGSKETRVYRLQHADAISIMQVLQPILATPGFTAARADAADAPATGAGRGPRPGVSLTADARTNSIVAIGSPTELETVQQLISALDIATVQGSGAAQPRGKEEARRLPDVSSRLDITVFQVSVPSGKAAELEAETLEALAKTPATLQAALQNIGATRLLYRFDRAMTTGRPARLEATAAVPVVQSELRVQGQPQQVVNREQLGARFDVFADPVEEGSPRIRLNAEGSISLLTQQAITGDSPRVLPVPRKMTASFDGITEIGAPAVFLAVDTNTAGDEPGTALVVRILVSRD